MNIIPQIGGYQWVPTLVLDNYCMHYLCQHIITSSSSFVIECTQSDVVSLFLLLYVIVTTSMVDTV